MENQTAALVVEDLHKSFGDIDVLRGISLTAHKGDVISMQEVFRFQRVGLTPENKIIGHFTATGVRSHFSERFRLWGYDLPASIYEPIAAQ